MFEENRALQRTSAKGGLMGAGNEGHLRNIARIGAYVCGWEAFSCLLSVMSMTAIAARIGNGPANILMAVIAVVAVGFVALSVVIFRWQPAWTYVLVLAWLVLQAIGSMIQAPISLGVVISIVLTVLTGIALRTALQLRQVRRRSVGAREVEEAFG